MARGIERVKGALPHLYQLAQVLSRVLVMHASAGSTLLEQLGLFEEYVW